jgi:NADPH-dependent 2,4-dienoyl-CoA reductase/sulfur reductase-like enzyme/rhodanese-related sulfurtransferase
MQEVRSSDVEGLWSPRRTGVGRRAEGRALSVSDYSGASCQEKVVVLSMTKGPDHEKNRVVIVGGVAGGMSTATRLRRLDADVTITVLERSGHVSFANCGLPYFVGGLIEEEEDLTLQTPEQLFDRFRLDVKVNQEVIAIDRAAGTVRTRSTVSGEEGVVAYDKLVLSMGAAPVRLPIPGYERVRTLRTVEDAARLATEVDVAPNTAVVLGAGFIGLEMAENLVGQGIEVTIVEATPQVLAPLDPELAILVRDELEAHGVAVETGVSVASVEERSVTLSDGRVLAAEIVVGAIGVRPDIHLAELAGLDLGPSGGIAVNGDNQTNDPDIYAVGDATEKPDAISHATSLIALANVANRQGRRVADHIAGRPSRTVPSLGTAIVKVFDIVAATVGWNERRLRAAGRPFRAIHSHPFDHATYYPGATRMAAKLIFDPNDGTILGAQIVGRSGVDKRIDVIATAMAGGIAADQLADLELAYAPPFSSAKDPVNLLGYMAENVLSGDCDIVGPLELGDLVGKGWPVIDVRTAEEHAAGAIDGSINLPIDSLRDNLGSLGHGPVVVYCQVGQRGHTATALMQELGISARNLDGGYQTWLDWTRAREKVPNGLIA